MRLAGAIAVAAPPDDVWAMLVDPLSLGSCMPGVRALQRVDGQTFSGVVVAAVGPMAGEFSFTSVVTRAEDGQLDVTLSGIDSVTRSRLDAVIAAGLTRVDAAATELRYEADVTVQGRLAILGEMVLRAAAAMMVGQVADCLRARVTASAADPGRGRVEGGQAAGPDIGSRAGA